MTGKIKIILAVGLLILGGVLAWYVQGLRADNAALQVENSQLHATLAANSAVIEGLKAQRLQDEELLQQWASDQERIKQLQTRLNSQIQKELQTNENFKTWAGGPVPDAGVGLLNSTGGD